MGVTSSNKQISAKRIECDGMLKVTLALSASPDITSNPTDIVWSWIDPAAWTEVRFRT